MNEMKGLVLGVLGGLALTLSVATFANETAMEKFTLKGISWGSECNQIVPEWSYAGLTGWTGYCLRSPLVTSRLRQMSKASNTRYTSAFWDEMMRLMRSRIERFVETNLGLYRIEYALSPPYSVNMPLIRELFEPRFGPLVADARNPYRHIANVSGARLVVQQHPGYYGRVKHDRAKIIILNPETVQKIDEFAHSIFSEFEPLWVAKQLREERVLNEQIERAKKDF